MSRRQVLTLAGLGGVLAALPLSPARAAGRPSGPVAAAYREALLLRTRWVEEQWDPAARAYRATDFRFVSVLGNAVALGFDEWDAELAGAEKTIVRAHTLATIRFYAATNRFAGGDGWGRQLLDDSTFELYFVLAARLLWDDLDERTRTAVQAIATGQAAYAYETGALRSAFRGTSMLAELGVQAQAMAPGLAWAGGSYPAPDWRKSFVRWAANASGLPAADLANPATVDGERIDRLVTAHNLHDGFVTERDGAVDPHHQAELWRSAGRSAAHFLAAGRPLPEVLTRQPNGAQLWRTQRLLASDAGEPFLPMTEEHYHSYARSALPLAFLAQVRGDRDAARAEADLAERLVPWMRHDPVGSPGSSGAADRGEAEARAELAVAYLLHQFRGKPVAPVSRRQFFAAARGTRDFGIPVGLTVQQSEAGFAAAVTREGFARFLWQPGHDHWLMDTRVPAFLPAGSSPTGSWTRAYSKLRDGVDATATVLAVSGGYAGYVTLPTGTVVYASTGLPGEGTLTFFNLSVPGIPGLGGKRTFGYPGGRAVLRDEHTGDLPFPAREARYVRMLGRRPATEFGYSIHTFSVLDRDGADLAVGAMPVASSEDLWHPARNATDGNPETRWAVVAEERGRADSWLAVDLGSPVRVAGVRLAWDAAYGREFVIQTSLDAVTWTDAVAVPETRQAARWVDIDGRAGVVVHGGTGRITVTGTSVTAVAEGSSGGAGPLVEGYPGGADLARVAGRAMPSAPGLVVSDADGHLSVFNLTPGPVREAPVALPSTARLYLGEQVATGEGLTWWASLDGGRARVEPPRFDVEGDVPEGTVFTVADSRTVTIRAPRRVAVTLRSGAWSRKVRVPAGKTRTVTASEVPLTPTADLARGRTTFPTSPLPAGMTSPDRAVDGDPGTSWRPGPTGRMVVDLARPTRVREAAVTWTKGTRRGYRIEASDDGRDYLPLPAGGAEVRYVALVVDGWRAGDAEVAQLALR